MSPNEILKLAKDALEKSLSEKRMNAELLRSIGPAIVDSLAPALERMANATKFNQEVSVGEQQKQHKEMMALLGPAVISAVMPFVEKMSKTSDDNAKAIKEALSNVVITINPEFKVPQVTIPEIKIPEIKLPQIVVPKITVPTPQVNFDLSKIRIPDITMPDSMNVKGWIGFQGYDRKMLNDPLPVQLRDADGNPVKLFENLTSLMTSSIGGGGGQVRIMNGAGEPVPVTGTFSASFSGSSLAAVPTNAEGIVYNSDNPMPVTGSFSSTPAPQVSGYADSVNVMQYGGVATPTGKNETTDGVFRMIQMTDSASSVSATQVGTWNISTVTTVTGITNSLAASLVDSSGVQYSGSNPVPMTLISGSISSTRAQIGNSDGDYSGTNPLPVTFAAAGFQNVAMFDAQQSSVTSHQFNTDFRGLDVYIGGSFQTTVADLQSGDNRLKVDGSAVTQPVSGTVTVSGVTASVSVVNLDRDGNPAAAWQVYPTVTGLNETNANVLRVVQMTDSVSSVSAAQAGTWNIGTVTTVTGVTNTIVARLDSPDGIYSAANPMPITVVSGAATTTNAVLTRQANPTAVAADYVPLSADDLGRQITRPVQVRDLIFTAYVTLSTGTETTLLAASAGNFHDLIYIMGANTSTAAVQVDIRAVTAGNVMMSLYIPANSTAGLALPVPLPQDATGNNWTVDMGDFTNSNVLISALFTREV